MLKIRRKYTYSSHPHPSISGSGRLCALIPRIAMSIVMAIGLTSQAATVVRDDSSVTFATTFDESTIKYTFKKCMANDLFTFYLVELDNRVVNSAQHSDNIGPFLVTNKGWIGGNHLSDSGNKSAETISVDVTLDGKPLDQGTHEGDSMEVNVVNNLFLPDGSVFAIEKVRYVVCGNSIEVFASHDFKIEKELTVERYYGMQSMFDGETQILAPGAKKYNKWLTIIPGGSSNAINIKGYEAPKFSAFVEMSPMGYQASYMVREDLGNRGKVGGEDVVFIGNSYQKSYHKLIGGAKVRPGDSTKWHGVYSWFKTPEKDTFVMSAESPVFEYKAYMGTQLVTLSIDSTGTVSVTPSTGVTDITAPEIGDTIYYNTSGTPTSDPIPGQMYVKRHGDEIAKVIMK